MRLLNLFTGVFLLGSGVSGLFQDSREVQLIKLNAQKDKRIEILVIDSVKHAVPTVIHDTVTNEVIHDSIVYKKKIITMPLTMEESLRIGNIEYPIIQKLKVDSFIDKAKKRSYDIQVKKGIDGQ